jgi:hypothetical protein
LDSYGYIKIQWGRTPGNTARGTQTISYNIQFKNRPITITTALTQEADFNSNTYTGGMWCICTISGAIVNDSETNTYFITENWYSRSWIALGL